MNRNYNGNGSALNLQATHAYAEGSDVAEFSFLQTATEGYAAYLWYKSNTAFAATQTVTATFAVNGTGVFSAYGSSTAQVRLFFQSNLPANKGGTSCLPAGYGDNYWWSESPVYSVIANGPTTSTVTLTTTFSPANWHGVCGQNGASDPNFSSALSRVVEYGLSFGSPSAYASGVGVTSGASTFQLVSYTIS